MTTERFNEIVDETLDKIRKVLVVKQGEYNLDADRLSVFKHAAALTTETPEQALYGFLVKHIISEADMVASGKKYSEQLWDDKVIDIINYQILLKALLTDDNMFLDKE